MKAFTASCPRNDRQSRADADCQYRLPWLRCGRCERDWRALGRVPPINPSPWIESDVWYPAYTLDLRANPTKFSDECAVTLPELNAMRKLIVGRDAKKAMLLPGSRIGPVRAKLPKRATDFVWCSFSLMASRRVIQLLTRSGLSIPYGPVVTPTGEKTDYVALQLDPVPLYSKATIAKMTLAVCPECGNCWMQDVRVDISGPRQYDRSRMPEEAGLVRVREGLEILATDRFIDVIQSNKLSGVGFEVFGEYV